MRANQPSPLHLVSPAPVARQCYVFHLYIAGMSPNSLHAVECLERLCNGELAGRSELTIVDLTQTPELAKRENVIAVPTLVRTFPLPVSKLIGDMSDARRLVAEVEPGDLP
jgi:circadian clock protein KaiB